MDDHKILSSILAGDDTFDLSAYGDYAFGYSGNDTRLGRGGNDSLDGGAGNDRLVGGEGADTISGGAGADYLDGGFGKDTLFGGTGNDRMIGGAGADTLTGDAGSDVFVLNQLKGIDQFTDFTSGVDQIQLSTLTYAALGAAGILQSTAFYAAAGATKGHDATDRVIYNTTPDALYYDADGSGAGKAIQIAILDGNPALAYRDMPVF